MGTLYLPTYIVDYTKVYIIGNSAYQNFAHSPVSRTFSKLPFIYLTDQAKSFQTVTWFS